MRRDAEFLFHAGNVQHVVYAPKRIAHGIDHGDVLVNQLRDVFVAGGDDDAHAFAFGLFGQRAYDVVGFHAALHDERPTHGLDRFV